MILSAIAAKLKQLAKADVEGKPSLRLSALAGGSVLAPWVLTRSGAQRGSAESISRKKRLAASVAPRTQMHVSSMRTEPQCGGRNRRSRVSISGASASTQRFRAL